MNTVDQSRRIFLIGSVVLGVLIIGGLIWAVVSGGPSAPGGETVGQFTFNDQNDPAVGNVSSTVIVRAFSDFQCPACRAAEPGFAAMKRKYADRVRIVWDDFPLMSIHKNALNSAHAARCAEAQGKFWEYHDMLYADQTGWSEQSDPTERFKGYAGAVGLNVSDFMSCYSDKRFQSKIMDDLREGEANGVDSTPTFFVNAKKVVGSLTEAQWDEEIQAALSAR